MSNKKFQYRLVREKSLKNLPVEAGNFIVTSDTNEMFADIDGKRVHIDRITEEELEVALEPKANKAEVYTKDEVDSQIKSVGSGAEEAVSDLETKVYEDIEGIRLDLSNRYTKDEIDSLVSAVFRFKGSVENEEALPIGNNTVGDVYNVNDTGANYAWDGKNWDKLSETIDLSPFSTKEEVALKADKTDLTNLATKEDIANFIDNSVIEGLSAKDAELEAAIALKADKTDLENLETDLGEKLIHNGTLTIQKNGVTIGTFGANQSEDTLVNIEADQQVNSDWEAEEGAPQILNKPTINSVELKGNVTLEALGVQPAGDYVQSEDLSGFATTEELETAFTSLNQMLVDAKTATGE